MSVCARQRDFLRKSRFLGTHFKGSFPLIHMRSIHFCKLMDAQCGTPATQWAACSLLPHMQNLLGVEMCVLSQQMALLEISVMPPCALFNGSSLTEKPEKNAPSAAKVIKYLNETANCYGSCWWAFSCTCCFPHTVMCMLPHSLDCFILVKTNSSVFPCWMHTLAFTVVCDECTGHHREF